MKAIYIVGSPREEGNTALLVGRIADGMRDAGIQVECHVLGQLSVNCCRGCRTCETSRRCVQRDDMDRLIAGIIESDVVLLASPSYWGDVTGQMKAFIDRSLPLCNARTGETPVPEGKVGIAVAVRAGTSKAENRHIVDTFEHYFSHLGIRMVASLTVEGVDGPPGTAVSTDKLEEAYRLGRGIL
jgi:multimeric flavodoxin WrbA